MYMGNCVILIDFTVMVKSLMLFIQNFVHYTIFVYIYIYITLHIKKYFTSHRLSTIINILFQRTMYLFC